VKRAVTRRNDAESIQTSSNTCKGSEKGCSGNEGCPREEGSILQGPTGQNGCSPKSSTHSKEGTREKGCPGNTSTLEESCCHETCPR